MHPQLMHSVSCLDAKFWYCVESIPFVNVTFDNFVLITLKGFKDGRGIVNEVLRTFDDDEDCCPSSPGSKNRGSTVTGAKGSSLEHLNYMVSKIPPVIR